MIVHKKYEPTVAWSKKTEIKTEKDVRKEKKLAKRAYEKALLKGSGGESGEEGESGSEEEVEDWKELVRERKRAKLASSSNTNPNGAEDEEMDDDEDESQDGGVAKRKAGTVGGGGISTSLDFGDL